jgi:Fe-S cluster assembly iron-binding protein IscA
MITLTPEAVRALRSFLEERGIVRPVRIVFQSTGCCDASLGLAVDEERAGDAIADVEGLRLVASPEVVALTGEIAVAYVAEKHREGFVLTSARPINEWSGFGVCAVSV